LTFGTEHNSPAPREAATSPEAGAPVPPVSPPLPPHPAQSLRLNHFSAAESSDVHCHCLPGLDDGPPTMDDAVALCEALVADGFTHAVATPHQLGRYDGRNSPDRVRSAADELRAVLTARRVPLQIETGADVRIDERVVPMLRRRQILPIGAAGRYLLLELPHEVFVEPRRVINDLKRDGVCAVITHPERYDYLQQRPDAVRPWVELGAIVQITAGSVVGDFGARAQQSAWHMLQKGWVSIVATDAHDTVRRPPRMTAAADAISKQFSHAVARRLCVENPGRVRRGEPLITFAARGPAAAGNFAGLRPRRPAGGVA
jgi:protein-tyrosine phosphatase